MKNLNNIAIIGSGPTAIYLLKNILTHKNKIGSKINSITIFEKEKNSGMGMPYNPETTDIYNLANISSDEIPELQETFGNWLRKQKPEFLEELNVKELPISDAKVYSRIALGYYFQEQYKQLLAALKAYGINIIEFKNNEVIDIKFIKKNDVEITDVHQTKRNFSAVVIANGHQFKEKDIPKKRYFASPWPIHKLFPKKNEFYNYPIGILGASLSAFDVVTSLAHRHGKFVKEKGILKFIKNKNATNFKIFLHSAEGWLPHLQYEQKKPVREIYRHFSRKQILKLINKNGFIQIEEFFEILCKPSLIKAFKEDNKLDVVKKLENKNFSFIDFINLMATKHEYVDSFKGMKSEMTKAKDSVENNKPINWMETLDDLMYGLNYHSELLSAEDYLLLNNKIMPFLMNVIAALPLQSANILLALYEANCIELITGKVTIDNNAPNSNETVLTVTSKDGKEKIETYKMFVNCGGQKKITVTDYPFQSLLKNGSITHAKAKFASLKKAEELAINNENIIINNKIATLKLPGIAIDATYKILDKKGLKNNCLFDINFTHTLGIRPYSYGLQACNATSLILVESWVLENEEGNNTLKDIEDITNLYEKNKDL